MPPMVQDPFRRFSWMSAAVWVGIALLLGTAITYYIERKMLEHSTIATLDYVSNLPRMMLADEDFVRLRTGQAYEDFHRTVQTRFTTPNIVSIKIFDARGTLVYHSHDRSLVGTAFPDNRELEQALQGKASLEMSHLQKAEQAYERAVGPAQLLEVYLPIVHRETGEIIGAYEVYSTLDRLYEDFGRMRLAVWSTILFGLVLLYLALNWTFRRASSTIVVQHTALAEQAEALRRAYDELKAAQADLVRSERLASAGRLAAGVVHEVGNPLASILGMVDLLLRCRGGPEDVRECRENLNRMASEIERLKLLLRGLIDYARPERVAIQPVSLNAVVERTLLLIRAQRDMRGIEVIQELGAPSPIALADEHLLQQLLVNIVLNAAQAMPQGGRLTVATWEGPVGAEKDGAVSVGRPPLPGVRAALIRVTDTGYGIEPSHLERIFEPFFSTKTLGAGTGLGLAICHSIIQELEGTIVVTSRPGEGTRFQILLPAAVTARMKEGVPS